MSDPFLDPDGKPRVVRGVAVISGSPQLAELAARLGFETVWIEAEHAGPSYTEVQTLCMAIEAGGSVPTVRLPNHEREGILKALEVGARIVIVPMVNDADCAREIVRHGKFAPLGERGFNMRSRGLNYSIDGMARLPEVFARANAETHLIAQIETMEAAARVEEICVVEGISGILIGPGDLSMSYGKPAAFTDEGLIAVVVDVIRRARNSGKHAGILVAPGPMLDAALEADCDLAFIGGDINDLAKLWKALL